MNGAQALCASCGAPDDGERVHCKYCRNAIGAEVARAAIPCPRCRTACRWGKQKCFACDAWIVVACVFCGAISPHHVPNCLKCDEAFAGAPARKAALEQERQRQADLNAVGQWAPVAGVVAAFAGGALGGALEGALATDGFEEERETFDNGAFEESGGSSDSYDDGDGGDDA